MRIGDLFGEIDAVARESLAVATPAINIKIKTM
jgi:hypothetical protein